MASSYTATGLAHHSHGICQVQRLLGADTNDQGPVGDYVKRLSPDRLETLARQCGGPISSVVPMVLAPWPRPRGRRTASSHNPFIRRSTVKLSARNQVPGKVVAVQKGQTTAHVRIDIGNGIIITSSITNEAVDDLGLAVGDDAIAVIKASDVMVAK
jgi:molybdopterin-binding protein